MSRQSQAMESFSRFVFAFAGALLLLGAVGYAFVAFDDHGCSSGRLCHTSAQTDGRQP